MSITEKSGVRHVDGGSCGKSDMLLFWCGRESTPLNPASECVFTPVRVCVCAPIFIENSNRSCGPSVE